MVGERQEALSRSLDLIAELLPGCEREEIDAALGRARIRLSVLSEDLLGEHAQAAVYIFASLVVRSGMQLEADLAPAPRRCDLPGLEGNDFAAALASAIPRMFPAARLHPLRPEPDFVVAFGRAADDDATAGFLRVSVDGRVAAVTRARGAPRGWRPANGVTALAGAGLAAGEVHKDVLRRLRGDLEVLEPLEPEFHCPPGVGEEVDLGRVEVISAGAITQNLLMVLVAEGSVSADVRVFDADTAALTNANRCPFVLIDRLGGPKVEAIAKLVPRRIRVEPVPRHLDRDTQSLIGGGATIVVGADDVEARHRAQARRPEWLGIGATSHFLVLVTEHPQGWACAGCAHAARGEDIAIIPTISIVSFWAGLLLALRLLAHAGRRPYPRERQVTNFWPLRPGSAYEHGLSRNRRCPLDCADQSESSTELEGVDASPTR